jgi:immune inhibitor A
MGTDAAQRFEDLFFSTEKFRTGSVTEYYNEISGGKISLNGEVISPLRMPCALPAYANGNSGMTDDTPNAQNMTVDALDALRGQVNLNQYDNDRNGYVDAFIMVHAGQGAEQTVSKDDIWSLKWTIPNAILLNDTSIFAFFTTPEDATLSSAGRTYATSIIALKAWETGTSWLGVYGAVYHRALSLVIILLGAN